MRLLPACCSQVSGVLKQDTGDRSHAEAVEAQIPSLLSKHPSHNDPRTGVAAFTPLLQLGFLPQCNRRPESSRAGLNEKPVKTTVLPQLGNLDTLGYFCF